MSQASVFPFSYLRAAKRGFAIMPGTLQDVYAKMMYARMIYVKM